MKNINNSPIQRRNKANDPNVLATSLAASATQVPSGGTDLTNLQNAINNTPTNGKLTLKQGQTYTISDKLNLKSNIIIDGNGATIIQTATNTATLYGIDVSNVKIINLTIQGNGNDFVEADSRLAVGIYIKGVNTTVTDIKIKDCYINNCTWAGIYLEKCQKFQIVGNKIIGTGTKHLVSGTNYQFGIAPRLNCQNGFISENDISQTAHGIYTSHEQKNTVIISNYIHDIIGQHGIYASHGENFIITNNTFENIALLGMKVQHDQSSTGYSRNIVISNNSFNVCGSYGINLENVYPSSGFGFEDVTITGNTMYQCADGGISVRQSRKVVVLGNVTDGGEGINATTYGLYLKDSSYVNFSDNIIKNVKRCGIFLDATADNLAYDIIIKNNRIDKAGQDNVSGGGYNIGIYTIHGFVTSNILIESNIISDPNNLSLYDLYIVGVSSAANTALRNNHFRDRPIRFGSTVTAIKEFHNNTVTSITGYPSAITKGRKATIYHGTQANAPTTATGYSNGDKYEYTDPSAGGYTGKILVGGVWKDFGAISA